MSVGSAPIYASTNTGSSKLSVLEASASSAGGGQAGADALVGGVAVAVGAASVGFDHAVVAFGAGVANRKIEW